MAWKFKYEKAEQAKRYAWTHQKTVEAAIEKKVSYEKCDNRKIQLEKKYKNMTIAYESVFKVHL